MRKKKVFTFENWWKGVIIGLIMTIMSFFISFMQERLVGTTLVIFAIIGIILVPIIYSVIIRAIYKK